MSRHCSTSSGRRVVIGLVAVGALVVGGCASDDTGGSDGSGSGVSVDAAAILGEESPATGEPIRIGYVDDGVTEVTDQTPQREAAEAATEYVNDHLGGIAGRPIELDYCSTDATPAGASDCVAQFARNRVPVVVNGLTVQAPDLFAPLSEAGIPVFITQAGDQSAVTTPGVYILANGIAGLLGGPAQLAAEDGIERAAIIAVDVPAASGLLEEAAPLFYDKEGVEIDVVTIPPETPEFAPHVQAALSADPGQVSVVGDPPFCTKVMNALEAAGYSGRIMVLAICVDETSREQVTNWEDAHVFTSDTTDIDSEEYQLYQAVMQTYAGDDAELASTAPQGYQAIVGFARAMAGLSGEVTADSIRAAFAAMPATAFPLADGLTYQCNGEQVGFAPNFCSTDLLLTTLDADGDATAYTVFDGAEASSLG